MRKQRAEKRKKTEGEPTSGLLAALAFTSPDSSVGLTPLPCPWWKYGVGETRPAAIAGGGTLRRDGGGGWMRKRGAAASAAARDRDLWCIRCRLLSARLFDWFPSDIFL